MRANGKAERRREGRKRHRLPVRFWDPHDPRTFSGVLVDESDSGAFIETDDHLPLRTRIRIEGPGVVFHAMVVRVYWVGPEDRQVGHAGMAVKLLDRRGELIEAEVEDQHGHKVLPLNPKTAHTA